MILKIIINDKLKNLKELSLMLSYEKNQGNENPELIKEAIKIVKLLRALSIAEKKKLN